MNLLDDASLAGADAEQPGARHRPPLDLPRQDLQKKWEHCPSEKGLTAIS